MANRPAFIHRVHLIQSEGLDMIRCSYLLAAILLLENALLAADPPRKTAVSIVRQAFHINGQPTYAGRTWPVSYTHLTLPTILRV